MKLSAPDTGNPLYSATQDLGTAQDAAYEATLSPDTHWTATVSTTGMTRIARRVVQGCYVGTDLFAALELVALEDHGFIAR